MLVSTPPLPMKRNLYISQTYWDFSKGSFVQRWNPHKKTNNPLSYSLVFLLHRPIPKLQAPCSVETQAIKERKMIIFKCKRQQVKMSLGSMQYLLLVQLDFDLQYLCGQFQQFSTCLDLNHVPINDKEKWNTTNRRLFLLDKRLHLHM